MRRLVLMVVVAVGLALWLRPPLDVERWVGQRRPPNTGLADVSPRARALHARLFVADLHADSLMWSRDLLARATRGSLDVPRMLEGGIALQALLGIVEGPFGSDRDAIGPGLDQVTFLALLDRWPLATLHSRKARALHEAARLRDAARRSAGRLQVIESGADLATFVERRRRDPTAVAAILGLEGADATDGEVAAVDELFDAGFRMMELAHYSDTVFGGSSSGIGKGGLTSAGRALVRRMEARGMIVDLAHASPRLIHDVLDVATRPVLVTHAGVRATCDTPRNLDDDHLDRVAAAGGVIGIGFFREVTCADDVGGIVRAILHVRDRVGAGHVALGSGFDAPVRIPIDAAGMVLLTAALLDAGLADEEIAGVMGGNVLRFLLANLPER